VFNTGYYLHPRSSISKTPLRLANSTGIVDAGYRGHLIAMLDVTSPTTQFGGNKLERYVQICAPGLVPILVEIVNSLNDLGEETARGIGGIGSTGK
jgi:dUTP pyrophosphatase